MNRSLLVAGAAAAALICATHAAAQTGPFSQLVVFGDSLSDVGNVATLNGLTDLNSFTTNPGKVTVEVVGSHYGFTLAPSLKGGTNYAYGGAGFINNAFGTPAGIPTLTTQINGFLAANLKLDPNAIYTVFGGGNDVNFSGTSLVIGTQTLPVATSAMQSAATQELGLISALQAAGARNIIVVAVPNVGQTPSAQGSNAIAPGSSDRIAGLAQTYNTTLNAGLAGRAGIIPVNAYALLDETVANPGAFGLTDVRNTACTTSSSLSCTTSTLKAANADQTWLFADGIHPTTAGHAALGNVILSELAAPQQISLLAETPLAVSAAMRAVTSAQLARGGQGFFARVGYSGATYDSQGDVLETDADAVSLTLGGRYPVNDRLTAGVALGFSETQSDFGQSDGGYENNAVIISLFGRHQIGDRSFVTADIYAANLVFDDITRRITLAPGARRQEAGSTDGSSLGASLGGSYWFGDEDGVRHGPFGSVGYQKVTVNAYSEVGARSTTMTFGRQERESLVTEIGWAIRGNIDQAGMTLHPYASAAYNHEAKTDPRLVSAGLVTMNGTFALAGFQPSDSWLGLQAGVAVDVAQSLGATFGYSGRISDDSQDAHAFSVGLNFAF